MNSTTGAGPGIHPVWEEQIDDIEWSVYRRVMDEARRSGVRFAFGGAFATGVYISELRSTKDFDFYILPEQREAMIEAIQRAGLRDHYELLPYDRGWIYRASTDGIIVDAIWAMANQRAQVDQRWLEAGPEISLRGELLRAIPIEELIWSKLYVLQRERSDWGDVLNLIAAQAGNIDWNQLIQRLGPDTPLLAGALCVFAWLDGETAALIPPSVWEQLGVRRPAFPASMESPSQRAALLDGRPWYRSGAGA
jgi:hypothetical protein